MTNYHLHVEILVESTNAKKFEDIVNGPKLRELFTPFGWSLRYGLRDRKRCSTEHGGRAPSVQANENQQHQDYVRYVNIWNVPDPPDIADVMQSLTDDNVYAAANDLVVREVQNLVSVARNPSPAGDSGTFIEVRRQLSVRNLGKFMYTSGIPRPLLESNGWTNCGAYQALTGTLNSITELWYTEKPFENSPDPFYQLVRKAGGLDGGGRWMAEVCDKLDALPNQEQRSAMDSYLARSLR
jgi:hypothetical protein